MAIQSQGNRNYKKTTVIGSFPDEAGLIADVIDRQLRHRINIVCDGQLRYDMNAYFAKAIEGFTHVGEKNVLNGKISGVRESGLTTILDDLKRAQNRLVNNKYFSKAYHAELKANITGPVTLAFLSELADEGINLYGKSYKLDEKGNAVNPQLWEDIGNAMGRIRKAYEDIGVRHIQIDEPQVTVGKKSSIPFLKIALERILDGRNPETKFYMHSCGDMRARYKDFTELEGIHALSFETAGSPQNLEVLTQQSLEANNKKLLLGVVDTKAPESDDVLKQVYRGIMNYMGGSGYDNPELIAAIAPHVNQGVRIYKNAVARVGEENIEQINPDCGMGSYRNLGIKGTLAAVSKLKILWEIQKEIAIRD